MPWTKPEVPAVTGRFREGTGKMRATLSLGKGATIARLSKAAVVKLHTMTKAETLKLYVWNDPDNPDILGFALDANGSPVGKGGSFSARVFYHAAGKPNETAVYDLVEAPADAPFKGMIGTRNRDVVVVEEATAEANEEANETAPASAGATA